jgi:hypothetical protein
MKNPYVVDLTNEVRHMIRAAKQYGRTDQLSKLRGLQTSVLSTYRSELNLKNNP